MTWIELAVAIAGWFITARILLHWIARDNRVDGEDYLAAGFLGLFWPLLLGLLILMGVLMLPALRWRHLQSAGLRAGWWFAGRHGVKRSLA